VTSTGVGTARFQPLPPERPANELEEELLARWSEERLFERVQAARDGAAEFVFFEGPPTANGRPGIHHVFARTVKDLFCRHRTMRGYHVTRKAGWDTHGLPVEIEVEKQLGISGKQQIEALGVERFNQLSRESVWRYREEWERLSERIGFWLDYGDAYVTYSNDYVESVWWALKSLHERDLLYRGHKILPYCPRCGTALSSHEVALGYKDVEDPSIYVAIDLVSDGRSAGASGQRRRHGDEGVTRRRILVWTTTPWTLPSNTALAVNPTLEYLELRKKTAPDWTMIVAEERAPALFGADWESRWDVVERFWGSDLVGARYRRPLDWVPFAGGEHELVVGEDFVKASDGTGVVHMAPAFGPDDYAAGQRNGLAFIQPVNGRGEFDAGIPVVGGMFVKAADPLIIEELQRRDLLWKAETEPHSYPHCWRCGTPLLQYARTSWFVRTSAYRDDMLARNARVNWNPPEVGEGRFGEWLKNNIDWAISRDRYWGSPLPVWVNDADPSEVEVIGSYAELAAKVGQPLPADFDPHKPFIDQYTWPAASGRGTMRRVPEVIDTWFDSGSMPFAQWHFPFEHQELTARHYPADFIAEGVDQTRGWFYSLLAIATGLGDALPNNPGLGSRESEVGPANPTPDSRLPTPGGWTEAAPYRAVVVNDLVLDAEGQKMSKSRGNAVDPWAVIERHGVDAVRLFLVATSQVWVSRRFDEGVIRESAGRFLLTLKNTYSGIFAQYANFGWAPSDEDPSPADRPALDRWVLSRLATVEREANAALERYDATVAARLVMDFVDEDVSKWYVRLSRARFYDVDGADNRAAFATLHEVLTVVCRLLAPFAPFVTDWMHRELTGASVHLAPYTRDELPPGGAGGRGVPPAATPGLDAALEAAMRDVRLLATLGRAAREEVGIKVRQPLSRLVCVVPKGRESSVMPLVPLLAAELNVKDVTFVSSADTLVTLQAKPNFRSLGKKFGKSTPTAAQAVAAFTSEHLRRFEAGEPLTVTVDGQTHTLDADDLTIVRQASGSLVVKGEGGYFAAVDPEVTPALRREGLARELVSRVQRLRRDAGLAVSDRVALWVWGASEIEAAVREFRDWIAEEVLAREIAVGDAIPGEAYATQAVDLDGLAATVALTREP